ncbi:hypothetical protein EAO70_13000 [Streptomyces sp. adm13(2018)]|uniref:hypothetical protein n=1 Tax=Streptomyces sp. adm13(2018) TaxID=2479007 RepID=UPI0011CE163E|nr:hypothetical protein [Streptomyces sp. adm13(2018)]TXS16350.1 hypothetical protein EAO70_13000 [Streptomyces sp. adm13(2018)]
MRTYLLDLAYSVGGAFALTLAGLAAAAEPFDLLAFDWGTSLTVSGSAATLALLHGVAARFQGDKDRARFTGPKQ